jgi:hypothetical protein
MKVSILTQPLGHNYGGLLQAYALQTHLKKIGCEVVTVDRRRLSGKSAPFKSYIRNVTKLLRGQIKSIPTAKRQALVLSNLSDFRDRKLSISPRITSEQGIRDYFRTEKFDAVIVGSDQVWRPRYSPGILNFYLDFLSEISSPEKRLTYAASFGVDNWEYTDDLTEKCKVLVKQFGAVSVREKSAIELCKDKFDISAKLVVDPTLLLEPKDYDPLINDCNEIKNKGCVLSYVLDPELEKRTISDIVGKTLDAEVFSIKPEYSIAQVRARNIDKCCFPSVESWLHALRHSRFIVTDSFHGMVFAILFNKPFIAIGNSTRGMARFDSLLSQLGLVERLVASRNEVTPQLIQGEIDWNSVNRLRRNLAEEGREFLENNLFGESLNG